MLSVDLGCIGLTELIGGTRAQIEGEREIVQERERSRCIPLGGSRVGIGQFRGCQSRPCIGLVRLECDGLFGRIRRISRPSLTKRDLRPS
jgi:hypothetical protein